jgi:hypothetical protein
MFSEARIRFDGNDACGSAGQGVGESARPGADLEHEVVRTDAGLADEFASEEIASKEMLTASPWAALS